MVAPSAMAGGGLPPDNKGARASILLLGLQRAPARPRRRESLGRLRWREVRDATRYCVCDRRTRAPAAIEQLNLVARKAGLRVHDPAGQMDPVARAKGARPPKRGTWARRGESSDTRPAWHIGRRLHGGARCRFQEATDPSTACSWRTR